MINDIGELNISDMDEMNIPVNSFLIPPDESDSKRWEWSASVFMPRRERCGDGAWKMEADSKEEIMEMVRKHVIPLYQAAVNNLINKGSNYYWEVDKDERIF